MQVLTEELLRTLIGQMIEAWNRRDLKAYGEAYAQNATFIMEDGIKMGRERILTLFREAFERPMHQGRLTLEVMEMKAIPEGAQHGEIVGSAVLKWAITAMGGWCILGFSLVVLQHHVGGLRILQEAYMERATE